MTRLVYGPHLAIVERSILAQRTAPLGCDFLCPILPFLPNKKPALWAGFLLLLRLFKNDVLAELFGVLFKLDLARNELFVLARPIHLPRGGVLEYYESVL